MLIKGYCERCGRITETDATIKQTAQKPDPVIFICFDCRVKEDNKQLKNKLSFPPYHLCSPPCKSCRTGELYTPIIKGTVLEPPTLQCIPVYPSEMFNYKETV